MLPLSELKRRYDFDPDRLLFNFSMLQTKNPLPPLNTLPCAFVESTVHQGCKKKGKLCCSRCELVSYCSKECQTKHWRTHKIDCNDLIRSEDWSPAWVTRNRPPTFTRQSDSSSPGPQGVEKSLGLGLNLWGRIPAMDLLNLPENEGCSNQDLSFACLGSGDLRNIVRTVNELPEDYSGEINVLLNDQEPIVVIRNIVLLLILGKVPEKIMAAEYALHAWYSAFVPPEYEVGLVDALEPFLKGTTIKGEKTNVNLDFTASLGSTSSFSGTLSSDAMLRYYHMVTSQIGTTKAREELGRVRYAPSRNDDHHFRYSRLEPSHRLAFLNYRTTGLVLPFGARNEHFVYPNRFLFSPDGEWYADDLANPLDSWDISAVIKAGEAHGAQRADLYGCLYFYLSDQLRTFVDRLRRFRIKFGIFNKDPNVLACHLRENLLAPYGFPAGTKFDRIDVANLLGGADRTKIPPIITDWGPMIKENKHATLIASFTEWHNYQRNAGVPTSSDEMKSEFISKLIADGRVPRPSDVASMPEVTRIAGLMVGYSDACTVYYDNSNIFKDFLGSQGVTKNLLRRTGIKLKQQHSILPHRLCVPLGSQWDALPLFPDKESWYLNACVRGCYWSERFVEFSRP